MDNSLTPSDLIAQRIRQLREGRGWTVTDLAARCAAAGMPRLTAQVLYKLEGQRGSRSPRPVTVDELLVLAYALDIAPVHLITGLGNDAMIPVTPELRMQADFLRGWIRGFAFAGNDSQRFHENVPASERLVPEGDLASYAAAAAAIRGATGRMLQAQEQARSDAAWLTAALERLEQAQGRPGQEG